MGKIQICTKGKQCKRAKQVVANKSGLSADLIIYELEKEKLQIVLKETKLHYEEKLVDQINVNDSRTTLDTLPLVILTLKGKTSQMIKLKQTY